MPSEPTFQDAQGWWSRMRRPVTCTGVPGHPWNPAVLWNTGLLFWPMPRSFPEGGVRIWGQPGLSRELEGYETDALQVEFSLGAAFHVPDRADNTSGEVAQELLDGRLPVVVSRVKQKAVEWTCTVFSRLAHEADVRTGAEDLLTEVRWRARNPSRRAATAQLAGHLAAPHMVLGYGVELFDRALPCLRRLKWESPLLLDDRRKARLAALVEEEGEVAFHGPLPDAFARRAEPPLGERGLASDVLVFRAKVPPGGEVSLRLVIPFFAVEPEVLAKALRIRFDRALKTTVTAWHRRFASAGRIRTPERIVNDSFDAYLCHAMLVTGRKPRSGHWILKTSPNHYEHLWGAHAAIAAFSMDLRGQHDLSRPVFETFLANQGPVPRSMVDLWGDRPGLHSEGFSDHPGFLGNIEGHMAILWAFYHGWTMWAIGRHARLTGDWPRFRRQVRRLVLASEWVGEQRRRTRRLDPEGRKGPAYGLLPAANAFDWGFGHMFWSDAHTYRGLKEIADCLALIRHPQAKMFLSEAERYRRDIVTAVTRSRDAAPPLPLEDGSSIPYVPMCVEVCDYLVPDWTYAAAGPLNLAWAGVVPADHELIDQTLACIDAGRPLGDWIEKDQRYRGWTSGCRNPADRDFDKTARPTRGRARYWRHRMTYEPGWIPQAFVFLARDDAPALLEHFYSLISNGGQHVDLRTPIEKRDGAPWTQPGDANLMWLMREMLMREEDDTLILAGLCPRAWLAGGRTLAVDNLLTTFGRVSFRLDSRLERGTIRGAFRFEFRRQPARIRLRLRHPEAALPKSTKIGDQAAKAAEGEWINLPPRCRRLEARY